MNFINKGIKIWCKYFIIFTYFVKKYCLLLLAYYFKQKQKKIYIRIENKRMADKYVADKYMKNFIKNKQYEMRKNSLSRVEFFDKSAGIWYNYVVNYLMIEIAYMNKDVGHLIVEYCLPSFLCRFEDNKCKIYVNEIEIKSYDEDFLKHTKIIIISNFTLEKKKAYKKSRKKPNIILNNNGQFYCFAEFGGFLGEIILI